jgi:hypothetical protein
MWKRLVAPDRWVRGLAVLASVGVVLMVTGRLFGNRTVARVGLWLGLPLLAVLAVITVVVLPLVAWLNRRRSATRLRR